MKHKMAKDAWWHDVVCNNNRRECTNSNSNFGHGSNSLDSLGGEIFVIDADTATADTVDTDIADTETNTATVTNTATKTATNTATTTIEKPDRDNPPSQLSDSMNNLATNNNDNDFDLDDLSAAEFEFEFHLESLNAITTTTAQKNNTDIGNIGNIVIDIDAEIDMDDEISLAEFHPPSESFFGSHSRNSSNNNNNYYYNNINNHHNNHYSNTINISKTNTMIGTGPNHWYSNNNNNNNWTNRIPTVRFSNGNETDTADGPITITADGTSLWKLLGSTC